MNDQNQVWREVPPMGRRATSIPDSLGVCNPVLADGDVSAIDLFLSRGENAPRRIRRTRTGPLTRIEYRLIRQPGTIPTTVVHPQAARLLILSHGDHADTKVLAGGHRQCGIFQGS